MGQRLGHKVGMEQPTDYERFTRILLDAHHNARTKASISIGQCLGQGGGISLPSRTAEESEKGGLLSDPILAARVRAYRMPLPRSWRDRGRYLAVRQGWLLQLRDRAGRSGWGECAPLPGSAEAADAGLGERLARQAVALVGREPPPLSPPEDADGSVRCALETALLDLQAQARGLPLYALLAPGSSSEIAVNATCGGLDAGAGARLRAAVQAGFRVFKFKLGLAPWIREASRLRRISVDLPAGGRLRLDANRAWSLDEARRVVADLAGLPVESLEEPLARPRPGALARLQAEAPFAIALDESLWGPEGRAWLPAPPVRRLALKPGLLGGPRRTLAIARRFSARGGEVVVTHALEAAPGVLLAMHAAAATGGPLAQGLDPGNWMPARQAALLPPVTDGRIRLSDRPGLGIDPEEALP